MSSRVRPLALVATVLLGGCDLGSLSGPTRLVLEVSQGDGQSGFGGWDLEQPIVVRVVDENGEAVEGAIVRFAPTAGGSVEPARVESDWQGLVSTRWRLGGGAAGEESLVAELAWAFRTEPVILTATAGGPETGDAVVVHGAAGPLRGAALSASDGSYTSIMGAPWSDTLFPLPPIDAPGRELIVFGYANRPAVLRPAWTTGADTVHVTLGPPISLDLAVDVQDGPFVTRRGQMELQVDSANSAWSAAGMGLVIGAVSFVDNTALGPVNLPHIACPDLPLADHIRVTLVTGITIGVNTWGFGCYASGDVVLAPGHWQPRHTQYLLAHEIGHTFVLQHTHLPGLMAFDPTQQGKLLRDGQTFRAHFDAASTLNTIYQSQPLEHLRDCEVDFACPLPTFYLGGG
jgi:hypothetical protein